MSLPDNRIRYPAARIDFTNEVGVTGQDHDNHPAAGEQPRYDWWRLILIGLLSQQSSYSAPTQYRIGTIWFDLNTHTYKGYDGQAWVPLANLLQMGVDANGNVVTLTSLTDLISSLLGAKPTTSFSGRSTKATAAIPIPEGLRAAGGSGSRPLVFLNGSLLDPRSCAYAGGNPPASIILSNNLSLSPGDTFTVLMVSLADAYFYGPDVII